MGATRSQARRQDLEEPTMEFLTSIPAAVGTMAVMVAFFVILTR